MATHACCSSNDYYDDIRGRGDVAGGKTKPGGEREKEPLLLSVLKSAGT